MRRKWGECLGSRFSFGIVNLLGFLLLMVPLFSLGYAVCRANIWTSDW